MSFTRTISTTDFRHRLKDVLDEVDRSGASLVVTRRGEPHFVVLTLEGYEDLVDAKLVASPLLQKRLSEARAHYEAGEGGSYETLRQELPEEKGVTLERIEQITQTSIAPLPAIYARLDRLEKEITALKQLVVQYVTAPTKKATPLGGLAKGSVVSKEDFAEARA